MWLVATTLVVMMVHAHDQITGDEWVVAGETREQVWMTQYLHRCNPWSDSDRHVSETAEVCMSSVRGFCGMLARVWSVCVVCFVWMCWRQHTWPVFTSKYGRCVMVVGVSLRLLVTTPALSHD